ncbi:hypothetical protein [Streptomyces sp. NBC_00987]|uniref:hypothetical protein n=1 Tax=Streptomyces sp. NBC_00987 TaxID=2903703 RepID=UPI000F5BFF1A|nr:hypothetical protein OG355_14165 [Streptomyces sp. NBC_00987]
MAPRQQLSSSGSSTAHATADAGPAQQIAVESRHGACNQLLSGSIPNWREAEYALMTDRESLYDWSKPWPPDFPVETGNVG